eukprot:31095-Chlamydomonas_euryale.AAC.2
MAGSLVQDHQARYGPAKNNVEALCHPLGSRCADLCSAGVHWHLRSKMRAAVSLLVQLGTVGGRSTTRLTHDGVAGQRKRCESSSVHSLHRKRIEAFLVVLCL